MFLSSLTDSSLGCLELLLTDALRPQSAGSSTTSDTSRGPGENTRNGWNDIGQESLMEGIGAQDFRKFADEITSYMRYLVEPSHSRDESEADQIRDSKGRGGASRGSSQDGLI